MEPFKHDSSEPAALVADAKPKLSWAVIFGRLMISLVSWSVHAGVTWTLLLIYIHVAGMARQDYVEYDLDLPAVSELVMHLSDGFTNYSYLLILALIVIDGPIAIGVCYLPRRIQWVTWIWFTSYLLIAILLLALAAIGLPFPFIDITIGL